MAPETAAGRWLALAMILALCAPEPGAAQQVPSTGYVPGTRIRIRDANATPLIGIVSEGRDGGPMMVTLAGDTVVVARHASTRIEVSRGRHSNSWKGARAGAIAGAIVGAAVGLGLNAECNCDMELGPEIIPLAALSAGVLGGGFGLVLGSLSSSERWAEAGPGFPASSSAVHDAAGGPRVRVGIAAGF
jgi:hypothetical protein